MIARLLEFLSIFSPPNMPHECQPVPTTFGGREGRIGNTVRKVNGLEMRGLAMEWVVWRRFYLNKNTSAASNGLGPLESLEAQGEKYAGLPSLTTRNDMERAIET